VTQYAINEIEGHKQLATSCLTYLAFQDFGKGTTFYIDKGWKDRYPLIVYAVFNWHLHFRKGNATADGKWYDKLFGPRITANFMNYLGVILRLGPEYVFRLPDVDRDASPLYYIAKLGLTEIAQRLIKDKADVNASGGYYGSPLQAAAKRGHTQMVEVLLQADAHVNAISGCYGTALQAALSAPTVQNDVVRLLLQADANVHLQGGVYGTALQAAASGCHTQVVLRLLKTGANVNVRSGMYCTALQAVIGENVDALPQLIFDMGTIEGESEQQDTFLEKPSKILRKIIFNILIEHGAKATANAVGGYYGSVLLAAVEQGMGDVVHLLLEMEGIKEAFTSRKKDGTSILYAAVEAGDEKILSAVLESGADVNDFGGWYGYPLQVAISHNPPNEGIIRLLLNQGADVDANGGYFGTALQAAAYRGNDMFFSLLLCFGADPHILGGRYGSALQAAASQGHETILNKLLDHGVSVHVQRGGAWKRTTSCIRRRPRNNSRQIASCRGSCKLSSRKLWQCPASCGCWRSRYDSAEITQCQGTR
jgi:ankyrin repeat protein